jgi:hypothetical protein
VKMYGLIAKCKSTHRFLKDLTLQVENKTWCISLLKLTVLKQMLHCKTWRWVCIKLQKFID